MATVDAPEPDGITRSEYYASRGMAVPNGNGSNGTAVRCWHCGEPLDGPASKRWCSTSCRSAYRRQHASAPPPPVAVIRHDTTTVAPDHPAQPPQRGRDITPAPSADTEVVPHLNAQPGDSILVAQVVGAVVQVAAAQLTAVTIQVGGVSVTVGRV
jgi:hypothetical protein